MNYSRIIVEAIMAMKRPPVTIPPFGRVPEQDSRSPRFDFRGDGASLYVFMENISVPEFFRVKGIL